MGKLIKLNIVSPGREVLTEEVVSLSTTEPDGKIEILANYAPTIIATIPTVSTYTTIDGNKKNLFTSSGIAYIKDNIINFCCDSFNFPEEIDKNRAEESLKRAPAHPLRYFSMSPKILFHHFSLPLPPREWKPSC